MSNIIFGLVKEVKLKDNDPDILHEIIVDVRQSHGASIQTLPAYPLDTNIKRVPVVGELVMMVRAKAPTSSAMGGAMRYFYITTTSLQMNMNHNVLPKSFNKFKGSLGGSLSSFLSAAAGNPTSNNEKSFDFEEGFDEVADLSGLQPFSGDVLIEGRYGQSLRLGHTPEGATTSQKPSWKGDPTKPITILRNHQEESGWNKFVIEDVNKDDTSIYLTSGQKINLSQAHPYSLGVQAANVYTDTQTLVNSGRVVLNARDERVVIAGKSDVNISTPTWKAAMDNMFTQIEEIKNELNALNDAVSSFATAGAIGNICDVPGKPNPPLLSAGTTLKAKTTAIKAKIVGITTELNLMKQ